jgi:hypothetical protein
VLDDEASSVGVAEYRRVVRPQADNYPEAVQAVLEAIARGGVDAGAAALAPIAYSPRDLPRRPTTPRRLALAVFRRDRFSCRYCAGMMIFTPICQLLRTLYPDAFPWHPNWKGGRTHPAVIARSPVVDHVRPGSQGGSWTDPANMVTACWPCNAVKADFSLEQLGWSVRSIASSDWDGLTRYYRTIWEAAGRPDEAYHQSWLALLDEPPDAALRSP